MRAIAARSAAAAAWAVLSTSLLAELLWLLWYGHKLSWSDAECKFRHEAAHTGLPTALALNPACALALDRHRVKANIGFLLLAPGIASLAAVALLGLRQLHPTQQTPLSSWWGRWSSRLLPPRPAWQWLCGGVTLRDALLVGTWAAFNAAWLATILTGALRNLPPEANVARIVAKGLAALTLPNLVLLFFPVSRGSAINLALGLPYPEAIRYHRWLGQYLLVLTTLHGLIYWISWASAGIWTQFAVRQNDDTNGRLGGVSLVFALCLWLSSLSCVRRWSFTLFKSAHHIGFWGFLLAGCAHHWSLFWAFLPGLVLYAVDGVVRLHQALLGTGADLAAAGTGAPGTSCVPWSGCLASHTEVLAVDVDSSGSMCSLLLATPQFAAGPSGTVWLNVPAVSSTTWRPFDYTALRVVEAAGGRVGMGSGSTAGGSCKDVSRLRLSGGQAQLECDADAVVEMDPEVCVPATRTGLLLHIKGHRWTMDVVKHLRAAAALQEQPLAVRVQGPYANPQPAPGSSDALVILAGGGGIAAVLPVFQGLANTGLSQKRLPALLIWSCRAADEMAFMAPRVLAAAEALDLQLTTHLYASEVVPDQLAPCDTAASVDDDAPKSLQPESLKHAARGASAPSLKAREATPGCDTTLLCPVVAFASFAAQLGFKAALQLSVFAGALAGILVARHVSVVLPMQRGLPALPTKDMGVLLVVLTAACSLGAGLLTLWVGLLLQRRLAPAAAAAQRPEGSGPCRWQPQEDPASSPVAAAYAMSGRRARLVTSPAAGSLGAAAGAAGGTAFTKPAMAVLKVPFLTAGKEVQLPVAAGRPPLQQLINSWVAGLQQLPAADDKAAGGEAARLGGSALQVSLHACGPPGLVEGARVVADRVNARQHSRRGNGVTLKFVCDCFQL